MGVGERWCRCRRGGWVGGVVVGCLAVLSSWVLV